MLDFNACTGYYYIMGFLLDVREKAGELVAAVPTVPEGYEIRLESLGGKRVRLHGGPVDGSSAEFIQNEQGAVTAIRVGPLELTRLTDEQAEKLPVTERHAAPSVDLTPEKQAAFKSLLDSVLERRSGGKIDYNLPYPKHEFLQYATARDVVIFHGSNNRAIEEFTPIRKSVELEDRRGFGNLQAVYGTHDSLWAMFFAVVDRARLKGSIRNGVMYMHNRAGERLAVYNFSVNQEQLHEQPWTSGAMYLLPREAFERQKFTEESYSNEWACHHPVRPLARLDVEPEDFPFLNQIAGHDDGIFIQAETLGNALRQSAQAARMDSASLRVNVPNTPEMARLLADYIEIQQVMVPSARFSVEEQRDGLVFSIDDLPPAYRQIYQSAYQDLLDVKGAGNES